jgi:hypothetical protein
VNLWPLHRKNPQKQGVFLLSNWQKASYSQALRLGTPFSKRRFELGPDYWAALETGVSRRRLPKREFGNEDREVRRGTKKGARKPAVNALDPSGAAD